MKLTQDWHVHTHRSKCGKPENKVSAIVETLDRRGMELAGLSDHIDTPEQREWFVEVARANRVDVRNALSCCRILVGTEATMLSPSRCALDPQLAAELDFVLVACNHYHLHVVENPSNRTPESYAAHYLDMLEGAASLGFATSVPHPFLNLSCGMDLALETLRCYDEGRLTAVLREAAAANMAFEINPYHARHAVEWFRGLVREARLHGVKFTLGSDSHTLAPIGYTDDKQGLPPEAVCHAVGLRPDDLRWPITSAASTTVGAAGRNADAPSMSKERTL